MPRIRTIKPEFPQSESMGKVSREARLCFILLWTLADDEGRMRGSAKMLASLLYPYDTDAPKHIEGWLSELEREDCITRYTSDGNNYLQIRNWCSHQKIDRPTPSKFPSAPSDSRGLARIREDSRGLDEGSTNAREDSSLDRDLDQRIKGSKDQGSKDPAPQAEQPRAKRGPKKVKVEVSKPEDVTQEVWDGFLALRKARNAPVTSVAIERIRNEAAKASYSLDSALAMCCARGWQGFHADWTKSREELAKPKSRHDLSGMDYSRGIGPNGEIL